MAIYRLSVKNISRSSGRSSVAASAYRSAENILDNRQGLEHDYSNRGGVLHTEILLPENAPDWMSDRSQLWNSVEEIEKRKDARLTREVVLSLPHELTDESRRELVAGFVQAQFVDRGMVADIALHAPGAEGDDRNHHAHIMLTTRTVTEEGFGGKDRSWNDKALLEQWREGWAHHANHTLEREGVAARVDHRSLKDRHTEQLELKEVALERGDFETAREHEIEALGFDREPLPHIGFKAWAMERRGIQTAVGGVMREAKKQMEHVRELVSGLREGLSGIAERVVEATGLSKGLEKLRASREASTEHEKTDEKQLSPLEKLKVAREQAQSQDDEPSSALKGQANERVEQAREARLEQEREREAQRVREIEEVRLEEARQLELKEEHERSLSHSRGRSR